MHWLVFAGFILLSTLVANAYGLIFDALLLFRWSGISSHTSGSLRPCPG
jgi:hypothetical protein